MSEWTAPRKTGNSDLLTGHLAGLIDGSTERINYAVEKLDDPLIIVNTMTKNRFVVTVRQIEGIE